MKFFSRVICALTLTGFMLSLLLSLSTYTRVPIDLNNTPGLFLLHLAALALCFVVILCANKLESAKLLPEKSLRRDLWSLTLAHASVRIKALSAAVVLYVVASFLLMSHETGGPNVIEGEKVQATHGRIIRKLTDEEYRLALKRDLRVPAGWWTLLFGLDTLIALSLMRETSQRLPGSGTILKTLS